MFTKEYFKEFGKESGIYKITNISNSKVYVGSAVVLNRRLRDHYTNLSTGKHINKILQRSWSKYKENNFIFETIEKVSDKNNLIEREQYWIDKLDACNRAKGFNISPIAGSTLGLKHTDEQKRKNSEAKRGSNSPRATIDECMASNIKVMLNTGMSSHLISEETKVKKDTIRSIKEGKSWRHIEPQLNLLIENFKRKLSEEDVNEIFELLSKGNKVNDIAKLYNVNYRTVSAIKNRNNWISVENNEVFNTRRARLSVETILKIKDMIENGFSNKEISVKFNILRSSVSGIRREKSYSDVC